jgi:hypothetical protein
MELNRRPTAMAISDGDCLAERAQTEQDPRIREKSGELRHFASILLDITWCAAPTECRFETNDSSLVLVNPLHW